MEGGFHPMSNYSQGTYQIDLKESVHLSYEQLPIEEIEEMELVPQVRIMEFGEEIEISGCLCLQGEYKGNQNSGKLDSIDHPAESYEESVQFEPLSFERGPFSPLAKQSTFEYRIPVKILLPKKKVRDIEDIYAHVLSFDYELKSPYQIDVTATFVISGFKEEEQIPSEFAAVAGNDQDPQAVESIEEKLNLMEEKIAEWEAASSNEEPFVQEETEEVEPKRVEPTDESPAEWEEEDMPIPQARQEEPSLPDNVILLPHPHVNQVEENQEEFVEEKADKDVRVAISEKGTQRDREPISSLSSIFSKIPKKEASSATQGDQQEKENKSVSGATTEPIYLTNFMEEKGEKFSKLRMCILQKDETVDVIAERYDLSVEAILRANQSESSQLLPGQILYIPMKG
jgi:stage VI sporulation protein D